MTELHVKSTVITWRWLVNAGDIVQFMMIGAGRYDTPPYSEDSSWRVGLLLSIENKNITSNYQTLTGKIIYRSRIFYCPIEQIRSV
jgi:hypothetical protein